MPETDDIGEPKSAASPEAVALYIGALTVELGELAHANGLDALGYILDMARLEADEASKSTDERDRWVDPARSRRADRRVSRHADADAIEERTAWIAIRRYSELLLHIADVVAQVEIDVSVEVRDFVTQCG